MIFSTTTQRAIRNKGMAAVYGLAAEFDCEPGDVLDLLVTTSFTTPESTTSNPSKTGVPAPISPLESPTPSQTVPPKHPAVSTSDPAPADVQAEELPHGSSADRSDIVIPISTEPQPTSTPAVQAHIVPDGSNVADERPTSQPGAEGAESPALITEPAAIGPSYEAAPKDEPGKPAEPSGSAAPAKRKRTKGMGKVVEAAIHAHPERTDQMHAAALGVDPAYIRRAAKRLGLKLASRLAVRRAQREATHEALKGSPAKPQEAGERAGPPSPRAEPKQPPATKSVDPKRLPIKHQVANLHSLHPDWDAPRIAQELGANLGTIKTALSDARAAAGESLSEPIPPANPQKPVAPPVGDNRTLTERVRVLHLQHPTWTATLIAKELGAKQTSVSTILGMVRGKASAPVEQPQFTGRRQMIEHYGEIAKRLGKSS